MSTTARVKIFGGPVVAAGAYAVWRGDHCNILGRCGNRRVCVINYGHRKYPHQMFALVPKKWLTFPKPPIHAVY